jgi:hypothetical protein
MKRIEFVFVVAIWLAGTVVRATVTNDAPDFSEVRDLLRANLPGVAEADLNRAAVEGLIKNLRGKAVLLSVNAAAAPATNASLLPKSTVLQEEVAYLRISQVANGLAKEISGAHHQLALSNKLSGVVLDLRFAGGDDYAAAAAVADLFLSKPQRLLDWGKGFEEAKRKSSVLPGPLAVLVNGETSGAAEALAAVLRESGAGLILGSQTAGRAAVMRDFPLKNGQRLRIATTPVRLSDGSAVAADGLKPDIEVTVTAEEERAYFEDAYAVLPKLNLLADAGLSLSNPSATTNRPPRRRINEADLVRERREGTDADEDVPSARESETVRPMLRDPVLVRALDLLKGLARLRGARAD